MGELLDEYRKRAGWDPRGNRWEVAKVFHLMRVRINLTVKVVVKLTMCRVVRLAMKSRRGQSAGRRAASFRMSISRIRRGV